MFRRLDEWVTRDRIVDSTYDCTDQEPGQAGEFGDGTDRKITRNQKRKHDEINHVQELVFKYCFSCHAAYLCR